MIFLRTFADKINNVDDTGYSLFRSSYQLRMSVVFLLIAFGFENWFGFHICHPVQSFLYFWSWDERTSHVFGASERRMFGAIQRLGLQVTLPPDVSKISKEIETKISRKKFFFAFSLLFTDHSGRIFMQKVSKIWIHVNRDSDRFSEEFSGKHR